MKGSTFHCLMIFHSIVREGSIRGAARRLEMSAPTVSLALKQLEQTVGLPLFRRTTRSMELTEAGSQLHGQTGQAIEALDSAMERVGQHGRAPAGKVRLTLPRFVFQSFLQPLYTGFCCQYPGIELELHLSDATVDIIREGIDLGIRSGDCVDESMVARPLSGPLREALFASPDYLARHGNPTTPEQLCDHRLIRYRFSTSNRLSPLRLALEDNTPTPEMRNALIVNDTEVIIDAAKQGLGIGKMIEPLASPHLMAGTLVPLLEPWWVTYPGLYLYYQRQSAQTGRVRALIDYLLAHRL
ncbi:MAG: hypothetical protein RIQ83_1276 [Pseudomonadota bacterium]